MTLARIIALALLMPLATGCGKTAPTSQPTPAGQPQPAVTPSPAPDKTRTAGNSTTTTPPGKTSVAGDQPTTTVGHEMDPAKHVIPTTAASGKLQGKNFKPDRVELEGDRLILRQGKGFFADVSIEIMLNQQKLKLEDGLKLVVRPSQKWSDGIPSLHVAVTHDKNIPDTKFINDDYAMTLELGKPDKGTIPGKLYLCLPDSQRSVLAGTFTAKRKRSMSEPPGAEEVPFIQGSVSPPLKKDQSVSVGYVGLPEGGGNPISDGAGGQIFGDDGSGGGVRSMSFEPRIATVRFEKFTPKFDFTNLPPGRYLVFARVKDGPSAWTWTDLPAGGKVTADVKLDAAKVGSVEVKLPADEREARLVPTDLGMPPPGERFLDQLAYSMYLDAEAKDGVAKIGNVPAGKYQVRAGRLRGEVEVVVGKTATVELKPAEK